MVALSGMRCSWMKSFRWWGRIKCWTWHMLRECGEDRKELEFSEDRWELGNSWEAEWPFVGENSAEKKWQIAQGEEGAIWWDAVTVGGDLKSLLEHRLEGCLSSFFTNSDLEQIIWGLRAQGFFNYKNEVSLHCGSSKAIVRIQGQKVCKSLWECVAMSGLALYAPYSIFAINPIVTSGYGTLKSSGGPNGWISWEAIGAVQYAWVSNPIHCLQSPTVSEWTWATSCFTSSEL